MNKQQLFELLEELAQEDLSEGCEIENHPCMLAIKFINEAIVDIESLKRFIKLNHEINHSNASKNINILVNTNYDKTV